jgi:hypothetical protein
MAIKYHEKNQAIFFGLQSNSGEANKLATSSLGSTTAIAATGITSDATRETGALTFLGDSLSRDEFTYQKDKYIDLGVETYQEVLFDLGSAINPDTYAIWKIIQTCGGNVVVQSDNTVYAGNHLDSPDYGTADVRYSTPDDANADKLFKFWDLRGTVDVDASIGEPPKLKFSLKGNADDPVQVPKQSADTGFQTTRVAPSVQSTTIRKAQIALLDDTFTNAIGTVSSAANLINSGKVVVTFSANHNLNIGEIIAINVSGASVSSYNGSWIAMVEDNTKISYFVKGLTTANSGVSITSCKKGDTPTYNFCFSTLSAPNFYGFDLTRYQTGCDFGFTKGAVPTDVTAGMLAVPAAKIAVTSLTISTSTTATVVTSVPHGMSTGNKVTIAGVGGVDALKINITATVTVTNTTTFTYTVASSTNGAVSAATGTIITAINNSNTDFDPDLFVTRFFGLYLSFGESNAAGKRVGYLWNKAQMSNTKEGKVSTYFGREATFRNTGQSFMLWS